jgi:hypothetical protein
MTNARNSPSRRLGDFRQKSVDLLDAMNDFNRFTSLRESRLKST